MIRRPRPSGAAESEKGWAWEEPECQEAPAQELPRVKRVPAQVAAADGHAAGPPLSRRKSAVTRPGRRLR